MAERRMFSKTVMDSDKFMNLPFSAQAVYVQFSMHADDDGFLGNSKRILRMVGATEEDYNILVNQGYLREFENSVVAIVHWKLNNYIQKDRYKPSVYRKERDLMYPEFSKKKQENQLVSDSDTQDSEAEVNTDKVNTDKVNTDKVNTDKVNTDKVNTDKVNTDKVNTDKVNTDKVNTDKVNTDKAETYDSQPESSQDRCFFGVPEKECVKIIDMYNRICTSLTKVQGATNDRKHNTALLLKKYTPQQIEEVFTKAQQSGFLCGKGERGWTAGFDWLIREDNFLRVYEGAYSCSSKSSEEREPGYDIDEYERKGSDWIDNWHP